MEVRETGGARVGGLIPMNLSAPFAKLQADQNEIVVGIEFPFFERTYRFPKAQVKGIQEYDGLFSKGIRVCHSLDRLPPFIVFWTSNRERLMHTLSTLGYRVIPHWEREPDI